VWVTTSGFTRAAPIDFRTVPNFQNYVTVFLLIRGEPVSNNSLLTRSEITKLA